MAIIYISIIYILIYIYRYISKTRVDAIIAAAAGSKAIQPATSSACMNTKTALLSYVEMQAHPHDSSRQSVADNQKQRSYIRELLRPRTKCRMTDHSRNVTVSMNRHRIRHRDRDPWLVSAQSTQYRASWPSANKTLEVAVLYIGTWP
jgi:hypothetical protein